MWNTFGQKRGKNCLPMSQEMAANRAMPFSRAIRNQLSRLKRPGWVSIGTGRVALVPRGVRAAISLVEEEVPADLVVQALPEEDELVFTGENRAGFLRETRIRPLHHAVECHCGQHHAFEGREGHSGLPEPVLVALPQSRT